MAAVELILSLLMVAAALEVVARRTGMPRPVLLVLAGAALAVVPGLPRVRADPGVVFFLFIPPLLYRAALTTSFRDFRRILGPILLLAIGLVVVTAAAVAVVAHRAGPGLPWPAAFALGAAVSPTDAVAATAVMRRIGVPRRLVSVLEGESLVNDATALVVFQMAVAASGTAGFSFGRALLRFVWASAGGVAIGLAAGWIVVRVRRWLDRSDDVDVLVESTVSLLSPYAAFIPADRLGMSGVLAVVALGLYAGHAAPRILSAQPRLQATQLWQMLNFVLEGLIFILVGLGLPLALVALADAPMRTLVTAAALVSATVIGVRLVGVASIAYLPLGVVRHLFGEPRRRAPWREVAFAGWAGLRGGMSLVVALSLPLTTESGTPFPGRDLVVFLTFAVICVTLVGQGLTLAGVIRWLDLRPDDSAEREEAKARLIATRAGLARLAQLTPRVEDDDSPTAARGADDLAARTGSEVVRDVADVLRAQQMHRAHRFAARAGRGAVGGDTDGAQDEALVDAQRAHAYRRLRLAMIAAERRELIRLRDAREISDGVLRRVEHDLDLEQTLLHASGPTATASP